MISTRLPFLFDTLTFAKHIAFTKEKWFSSIILLFLCLNYDLASHNARSVSCNYKIGNIWEGQNNCNIIFPTKIEKHLVKIHFVSSNSMLKSNAYMPNQNKIWAFFTEDILKWHRKTQVYSNWMAHCHTVITWTLE